MYHSIHKIKIQSVDIIAQSGIYLNKNYTLTLLSSKHLNVGAVTLKIELNDSMHFLCVVKRIYFFYLFFLSLLLFDIDLYDELYLN